MAEGISGGGTELREGGDSATEVLFHEWYSDLSGRRLCVAPIPPNVEH